MATRSRPAQGNNTSRPYNRPRPAYRPSIAPTVVSAGTLSRPKPNRWRRGRTDAPDAQPTVVAL